MPIKWLIKLRIKAGHEVGIWPGMGNKQEMEAWIIGLEVKSIKIFLHTRGQGPWVSTFSQ